MGEHVRDDAVLARVHRQPGRLPLLPGAGEVGRQRRVVDGQHGVVGLRLGVDEARAGLGERLADPLGARGQLGARRPDADPDLAAGVVQPVTVAPDHGHRESHRLSYHTPPQPNGRSSHTKGTVAGRLLSRCGH